MSISHSAYNPDQILCTDVFFSCLSKAAQKHMRQLDKVIVKGSATPMNMYTYDTFQDQEMVQRSDKRVWGAMGYDFAEYIVCML